MKRTIDLGKVDYNKSGRRNCRVTIEIELRDKDGGTELSICGNIWNPGETDCYSSGQNTDTIRELFSHNPRVQRLCDIWDRWHLNALRAGTVAQSDYLRTIADRFPGYPTSHYDWAKEELAKVGLQPDNGYNYGSAWLTEPLPAEIVDEVTNWTPNVATVDA